MFLRKKRDNAQSPSVLMVEYVASQRFILNFGEVLESRFHPIKFFVFCLQVKVSI